MLKISPISMVVNAAGVLAALVVGSYAVNSFFAADEATAPCSTRYPAATAFSTRNDRGFPMSAIELQSRMGADEWGVLENVEVVQGRKQGGDLVRVRLPQGTSSAYQSMVPQGGTGFVWSPETMHGASAACLAYSVTLPKDFDFSTAGMLPGMFGGERLDARASNSTSGFSTRIMWKQDGSAQLVSQAPAGGRDGLRMNAGRFKLERGRPVKIETEVVLNTPGAKNGTLRLWVDGEIKAEARDIVWRSDTGLNVSGVLAEIAYGSLDAAAPAPVDTAVLLSPFELSWE